MSIYKKVCRLVLVLCLLAQMVGCADGDGSSPAADGSGGSTGTTADTQSAIARQLSSDLEAVVGAMDQFSSQYGDLTLYDEAAGNAWLSLFNDSLIPRLDSAVEQMDRLIEGENELAPFLATSYLNMNSNFTPSAGPILIPLIAGGVFLAAAGAALLRVGLNVKQRVQTVENKLAQARAEGHSQAKAMELTSEDFWQGFGDTYIDLQTYILTNKLSDMFKEGVNTCGAIAIDLFNAANDSIDAARIQMIGAKKKNADAKQLASGDTANPADIVYMGETTDGTFENLALGTWDMVVYTDGYVRNVAQNVDVFSCDVTIPVAVGMVTMEELQAGSGNNGNETTDFEVSYYINSDGTAGSGAAGAEISLSGSTAFPSIGWTLEDVTTITLTTGGGEGLLYGISRIEDEEDNLIPFSPPATYGNYSLSNTVHIPTFANPSPALIAGIDYGITLYTDWGDWATIVFRIR